MNIFLWLGAASVNLRPGCAVLICLSYNWYGKPVTITPSAVFIHWDQYFVSDRKALYIDPGPSLKNISALMLYLSSIKTGATKLLLSAFGNCFKTSVHTFVWAAGFCGTPLTFLHLFWMLLNLNSITFFTIYLFKWLWLWLLRKRTERLSTLTSWFQKFILWNGCLAV